MTDRTWGSGSILLRSESFPLPPTLPAYLPTKVFSERAMFGTRSTTLQRSTFLYLPTLPILLVSTLLL